MKTNAVRLLESLGVHYELRDYEVDPEDLAAESVAAKVGLPPEQVFKTLVARGDREGSCFAVVPGNCELDLKALAACPAVSNVRQLILSCNSGLGAQDVEAESGQLSPLSDGRLTCFRATASKSRRCPQFFTIVMQYDWSCSVDNCIRQSAGFCWLLAVPAAVFG